MVEISESLRLLFETSLEDDGDRYVIPVPSELVENGSLSVDESYRTAILAAADASGPTESAAGSSGEPAAQPTAESTTESAGESAETDTPRTETSDATSRSRDSHTRGPPVDEGEVRSVTIDTLGDQGDGIAKVERGFIVIVSDTQPGDQVDVEITDVKENVAFAEPVGEATVR